MFLETLWVHQNCHFNAIIDRDLLCGLNALCSDWHGSFYVGGTTVSPTSQKPACTTPTVFGVFADVGFCCVIPFRGDLGWIIF